VRARDRGAGNVIGIAEGFQGRDGGVRSSVVHGSTKAERRAARERVSSYYDAELAKLVERVEQAIPRYRVVTREQRPEGLPNLGLDLES
jgi:hypothetical protein